MDAVLVFICRKASPGPQALAGLNKASWIRPLVKAEEAEVPKGGGRYDLPGPSSPGPWQAKQNRAGRVRLLKLSPRARRARRGS